MKTTNRTAEMYLNHINIINLCFHHTSSQVHRCEILLKIYLNSLWRLWLHVTMWYFKSLQTCHQVFKLQVNFAGGLGLNPQDFQQVYGMINN